ncbi:MAG: CPBP family intramembrane metalloprotease [Planctomycetes bacterium]|nr:CPBP family intramembrane metalloprotease [Planctomycetota bacterium]
MPTTNEPSRPKGERDALYVPHPWSLDSLSRLGRLVRKELLEILRDRRTIITLVAMPLLLYPLLSFAFKQFFLASQIGISVESTPGADFRIGAATSREKSEIDTLLHAGNVQLRAQISKSERPAKGGTAGPPPEPWLCISSSDLRKFLSNGESRRELNAEEILQEALRQGIIQLIVRIPRVDANAGKSRRLECELVSLEGSPQSQATLTFVERRIAAYNAEKLSQRLDLTGAEPVTLLSLRWSSVKAGEAGDLISLAALVPLILILMTITGAVYPAIDLTAGERERGTLEILVAAPVPRLGLLFAKYVTVFTVAVLTAVVNLVSMVATLMLSGMNQVLFRDQGLDAVLLLELFGLLLLFAAFFSAVLLSLTSFARSFKEAQAYLIPLMLASLAPGLAGMLPGLKLDHPPVMAVTPLVNIVLLARDLFNGDAVFSLSIIVVVSTLFYAVAAILLAARIFGAEGVLFSEQTGWRDLFRRPLRPQDAASVPAALWCLALMAPTLFVMQSALARSLEAQTFQRLLYPLMFAVTFVLFGILPAIGAWLGKVRWISGFGARPPRLGAFLGGAILGCSLWPIVLEMLAWLNRDSQALEARFGRILESLRQETVLPIAVACMMGIGVLEEWFFRGFLFQALRGHVTKWGTIGLTAVLFGLTHVIQEGLERMAPSTLQGFVLGWVCWETGSVIPGMILHALNNGILIWISLGRQLEGSDVPLDWRLVGSNVPVNWVAVGVAGTLAGFAFVWFLGRKRSPATLED